MSAAIQPMGITQSIQRVGAGYIGKGLAKFMGAPRETADEINEKSDFMRTRYMTRFRELNEVRTAIKGRGKVRKAVDESAYYLMLRMQQSVDIPTWWGAYEKAYAEGELEDRAVALADQAVIDSQGSGMIKDQSEVERGDTVVKLFTTFYSFFNTALNLGTQATYNKTSKAKLAADYLMLFTIPAVMTELLKNALTAGGDDDLDKLAKKLAGAQISYLMGTMAVVRELTTTIQSATNTAQYSTDYQAPAGMRLFVDLAKLGKQIGQGELDDGFRRALISLAGDLLRFPAAQINRSITGIEAISDGKTSNPLAPLTGYQKP